jgi:hypothetical protein
LTDYFPATEHDWRLKPQTKQLVQDLRTLRTLFQSLIQYDCISFWKLINSIRTMSAASRNPSMWLLTPAADMLFRKAKERVYKIVRQRPTEQVPQPVAVLKPVLEENLKWKLLRKVLAEIREEQKKAWERDGKWADKCARHGKTKVGGSHPIISLMAKTLTLRCPLPRAA